MVAEAEGGIVVVEDVREAVLTPDQVDDLEIEEEAPPSHPGTEADEFGEESEELIGEIERIIEETRDLHVIDDDIEEEEEPPVELPEDVAREHAAMSPDRDVPSPETAVDRQGGETLIFDSVKTLQELSRDDADALPESADEEIAVVTDFVDDSEPTGEIAEELDSHEEIPDDEAIAAGADIVDALEDSDDFFIEAIEEDDEDDDDDAVEVIAEAEEVEIAEPPPPAPSLPPGRGYGPDAEFWAFKEREEDKDLDEVLGTVQTPEDDALDDDDEDLLVLDDEIAEEPAAAPVAAPVAPVPQPPAPPRPSFERTPARKGPWALVGVLAVLAVVAAVAIYVVVFMSEKEDPDGKQVVAAADDGKKSPAKADKKKKKKKAPAGKAAKKKKVAKKAPKAGKKKVAAVDDQAGQKKGAGSKEPAKGEKKKEKTAEELALEAAALEAAKQKEAADAAADQLTAGKENFVASLRPMEERYVSLTRIKELADQTAEQVASLSKSFADEDKKTKKKQAAWGETLAGMGERQTQLNESYAGVVASLEELKAAVEQAQSPEDLEKLAESPARLGQAITEAENHSVAFLKDWNATYFSRRVAGFEENAGKLNAKQEKWTRAKQAEEAKAVAELETRAQTGIKEWRAQVDAAKDVSAANVVEAVNGFAQAYAALDDLEQELLVALAKEVKAAEKSEDKVAEAGKEKEKEKELSAEERAAAKAAKARKKELSSLMGKVKKKLSSLGKLKGKLSGKAKSWKEAGKADKEKACLSAKGEVEDLRRSMADIKSLLERDELEQAKVAYSVTGDTVKSAEKRANRLLKEKVKVASKEDSSTTDKGSKEQLKAHLKTLKCPGGTQRMIVKNPSKSGGAPPLVAYCIDRHEYPGRGRKPKTNVSWDAANGACTAQGKRLCHNWEWKKACGGKYPYGSKYDPNACNTVGEDGLERPVLAAGSKKKCKGRGLYDMVGNVAEWTAEKTVNGGDSNKTGEEGTCYRSVKRFGGSSYVGFRCCADPK